MQNHATEIAGRIAPATNSNALNIAHRSLLQDAAALLRRANEVVWLQADLTDQTKSAAIENGAAAVVQIDRLLNDCGALAPSASSLDLAQRERIRTAIRHLDTSRESIRIDSAAEVATKTTLRNTYQTAADAVALVMTASAPKRK